MEIKELETQTEREMAAVILEQVLEIRKLRLALKAHDDVRLEKSKKELKEASQIFTEITRHKMPSGVKILDGATLANSDYMPTPDPMAVDVRSVV